MNQSYATRAIYLSALAALAAPIIWAAWWYNRNAFDVRHSATQQLCIYLFPFFAVGARAWLPKVNHVAFILFFCVMTPLVTLTYTERNGDGWLFSLLQLPVIWAFGLYACISLSAYFSAQAKSR